MDRVFASEIDQYIDKKVTLYGWLNNIRPLGKITFLILRDGSGFAQIVVFEKKMQKILEHLQPGSVLKVQGTVAEGKKIELIDPEIEVIVPIHAVPPLEYYKPEIPTELEHILDHRSVSLRNRRIQAYFKIQAEITHAFRLFMHDQVKAVEYFGPNIIGASSEGGAEFFNVDYFGYSATLAQSSQLYKQVMVGVNERVFALMPFFRAENSHTPRHLTEGKQFEFEMATYGDWKEVLDVQEMCLKFMVGYLEEHCKDEVALVEDFVQCPQSVPFPRITFKEAQEIFFKRTGIDDRNEPDLSPRAEKELSLYSRETFGTDFLFVIDWNRDKRPFYSYPNDENPELTNTFDLICRGSEITSGGQRRHTYDSMVKGIQEKGMDPDQFEDYLDIFKYGMPPHGGFGMGLERLTMTLLGVKNIREVSLFPSDPKRIAGKKIKAHIFFGEENVRNEIIRLLREGDIDFDHQVHEPTPTSTDSSNMRGTKMEEGVKAIILKGKKSKKNYQFNLSSNLKLDMKAIAKIVGEKCEFESPEVIKERYGVIVGGVPPFGHLFHLDVYFDENILKEEKSAFNCGMQTESIVMSSKELVNLAQGTLASFTTPQ
ncbi:aspartate--tRNA(Asn) ligase [Chlamydiales bacterium]|nr:aspartate--tRNA(Asn) ligase [Chlamydiales bacterium]